MTTEKILELPSVCTSIQHNPPGHMVYSPGIYKHTCPQCGHVQEFCVARAQ